jgi:hypothetical protein
MTATDKYARLATQSVVVGPDRQRTELDLDESFVKSIAERGILAPLLVTSANVLVAGGRRLAAATKLGAVDVPVRYVAEGLSNDELRLIELEENVRRCELPWRDHVRAVAELHALWAKSRPGWTTDKTSAELGVQTRIYTRVARELDNPKLAQATNVRAAFNICARLDERLADAVMEDISHSSSELLAGLDLAESALAANEHELAATVGEPAVSGGEETGPRSPPATTTSPLVIRQSTGVELKPALPDVLCADFISWSSTYAGSRFNFLHCDFPYGKRVFAGEWGGKHAEEEFKYDDDPSVYWKLIEALCANLDRLLTPTAHMMFWLSSEIENIHATIERFRELAPSLIFQPRPLVWLKSCNTGITPDPVRAPRWICEFALTATRGDRPLVRPLASGYAAPTARSLHPSTKPEPVLRHFFGMYIDSTSRVLDPTCGAGSALRAAESLGAASVMGIERSEEYVASANKALRDFRNLRELTR